MEKVEQSADLLRFFRYLNVDISGEVVANVIDDQPNFISRFYTPHTRVNKISSTLLDIVRDNDIGETNKALSKDSLTYKFLKSGLKLSSPRIYELAQIVVLESFALIYAIEEEPEMFKMINESDVKQTRENVKYLIDCLGGAKDYTGIVMDLQSMDVALGYIQEQVPLIQGGLPVNGTI
ncbi:Phage protein [Enterococcus phage 156]|nr:Phage protein [Enterococcus phage 156]VDB76828.1 Phage protein [Enterococcus phage 156]